MAYLGGWVCIGFTTGLAKACFGPQQPQFWRQQSSLRSGGGQVSLLTAIYEKQPRAYRSSWAAGRSHTGQGGDTQHLCSHVKLETCWGCNCPLQLNSNSSKSFEPCVFLTLWLHLCNMLCEVLWKTKAIHLRNINESFSLFLPSVNTLCYIQNTTLLSPKASLLFPACWKWHMPSKILWATVKQPWVKGLRNKFYTFLFSSLYMHSTGGLQMCSKSDPPVTC